MFGQKKRLRSGELWQRKNVKIIQHFSDLIESPIHRFLYAAVLILIFTLFLTGCPEEKVQPSVDSSLNEEVLPSQEGWNSVVNFSEDGKLKAVLHYDHMRMYEDKRETLLDGVKLEFYNDEGVKTTTLTSLKGRVDDNTKNMWAIDSVVAKNDSGVTLKTQELMWRHKDKKIVSDKFVTIISPKEKIQGYGFESDENLRNYVIYKITYITSIDNSKQKTK
jgi:LPS export ABC transporter protein LptC